MTELCCVCLKGEIFLFYSEKGYNYWRCKKCWATYLDRSQLPNLQDEYKRYCEHDNDPSDPKYRKFLNKLLVPLLSKLTYAEQGLDYGCGPGPTLSEMLIESKFQVSLYDPFFYPDSSAFKHRYDFVTCSEVVEHFHWPHKEFAFINSLLRSRGWLGIMTNFQTEDDLFSQWHYRRDPTHVTFYKEYTFRFLAKQFNWRCEVPRKNIVLMQKLAE